MATTYNFDITQGSSYNVSLTAKNNDGTYINLSGYSSRGVVKYKYSDTGNVFNLSPVIHSSLVSGIITLSGSGNATSSLIPHQYVYDVEIYDSGNYVLKVLKGYFNVSPEVSN